VSLPAVPVSQTPENKFREFLNSRAKPQRFTAQQRDIIQYVFSHHDHFDADQLILEIQNAGMRISRATIYRMLTKLVEAGLLRRIEVDTRTVYEHDYGYPQHEHLVCEKCKKMIEFQHGEISTALREICAQHNFQMSGHTLVVRGICSDCNRARNAKRRLDMI
jgi:Fur family transcriptional regulator, ferric uptake regulator